MKINLRQIFIITFIFVFQNITYGQNLKINDRPYKLKSEGINIFKFDAGEKLEFKFEQKTGSYKYRILPLSHENTYGYININCDESIKKTNKIRSIKRKIKQQDQEDPNPHYDDKCNNDFTLETANVICINRIIVKIYSSYNDNTNEYIVELRPNQTCD